MTHPTSSHYAASIVRHWRATTLTAPCQRLNHTHPRSAAFAIYAAQIYNPKVGSNSRSGIGSASARAGFVHRSRPSSAVRFAVWANSSSGIASSTLPEQPVSVYSSPAVHSRRCDYRCSCSLAYMFQYLPHRRRLCDIPPACICADISPALAFSRNFGNAASALVYPPLQVSSPRASSRDMTITTASWRQPVQPVAETRGVVVWLEIVSWFTRENVGAHARTGKARNVTADPRR